MIEKNKENDEDEILSRLACIEREIEKRAAYPIRTFSGGRFRFRARCNATSLRIKFLNICRKTGSPTSL